MSYQIKKMMRKSLNVIIAIQLSLIPYYGYGSIDPNSVLYSSINQIQNNGGTADQELLELSSAIEEGQLEAYLQKNPLIKKEVDYFLLSDQKVSAIEHHFDTEKQEVVESVSQTMLLNEYNNRPIEVAFKEVQIQYQKESQTLVFEGISEGAVRLRQYIPDIDIVHYVNDGEILAILDRKKGLLLVDMILARSYLGLAPVPVAQIPVPVLQTLSELSGADKLWTKENTLVEFIYRGARPPDIVVEEIRQKIDKTFDGRDMVTAGDLMISYTDQNGQKHLVQFLKRGEIKGWLGLNYKMLDIMTKVVAPHLMQKQDIAHLEKELKNVIEADPKALLDHILSTFFNKQALYKLNLASKGIQKRIEHLETPLSERDTMTWNEWKGSFQKIMLRLQEKSQQEETNQENTPLPTAEIAGLLNSQQKKHRAKALQIIANWTAKLKQVPVLAGVTGAVALSSVSLLVNETLYEFTIPKTFIALFYKLTSIFNNMAYSGDFASYKLTAIPNFSTLLLFVPMIVILGALAFNPIMKLVKDKAPQSLSIGNKVYHPKGRAQDILNKWESANVIKKFVGAGMKLIAFGIDPLWNKLARYVGQPHFISALQKGLNPWQIIDPKSDVGEQVGLKVPTRLGVSTTSQWTKTEKFDQQRRLQNVALAKENGIKKLAWLLSVLAVAEREKVTPDQIIMYGITGVNFEDLKKVQMDMTLSMELIWTVKHLVDEIKTLDEVDIRKVQAELEPEMIVRYYKKAKEVAQQAKAQPYFFKKTRAFWNTGFIGQLKHGLSLQSIASFNKDTVALLHQVPTDFVANRSWRDFVPDHFLVTFMPLLMTSRADLSFENIYQTAVNENFLAYAGKPHVYDVVMNAFQWLFISGAGNAIAYTKRTNILESLQAGQKTFYEPLEIHEKTPQNRVQTELSYFKNQIRGILPSDEPDKMRMGNMWLKRYIASLRSLQMGIIFMLVLRLGVVGQPLSEAVLGWLIINLAQFWFLGWPWMIVHAGNYLNTKDIAENKKKMETVLLRLSRVRRGLYSNNQEQLTHFTSATHELQGLYSPKQWGKLQEKLDSLSSTTDPKSIQKRANQYINILIENPPLFNTENKLAEYSWTFWFATVITTYLGVELFIMTFNSDKLTIPNILEWAGINMVLLSSLYWLYKKSVKERWVDLKTGRMRTARYEKIKQELKEWQKAIHSLKPSEKSWSAHFYNEVLNLSHSASQKCQRAFRKTKK